MHAAAAAQQSLAEQLAQVESQRTDALAAELGKLASRYVLAAQGSLQQRAHGAQPYTGGAALLYSLTRSSKRPPVRDLPCSAEREAMLACLTGSQQGKSTPVCTRQAHALSACADNVANQFMRPSDRA